MIKKSNWEEKEHLFLEKNYCKDGPKFCSENLNRSYGAVVRMANKLQIKTKRIKNKQSLMFLQLNKKNISKELAYVLGFIWADGHLSKERNGKYVRLTINKEDGEEIKEIMLSTEKWNLYNIHREKKWKPILCFNKYNIKLWNLLISFDFDKKSLVAPTKILNFLDVNLHKYFFRGLSDGDGCFYINKKQYTYQYSLSSTLEQDWSCFTNLLEKIGVEYKCEKRISDKSKSSSIRLSGQHNVIKFGEFLYEDYDKIGLERKYNKYKDICSFSSGVKMNKITHSKEEFLKMAKDGMSIADVIKKYNYSGFRRYLKKHKNLKEIFEKNSKWSKPLSKEIRDKIKKEIKKGTPSRVIKEKYNIKKGVLYFINKEIKMFS